MVLTGKTTSNRLIAPPHLLAQYTAERAALAAAGGAPLLPPFGDLPLPIPRVGDAGAGEERGGPGGEVRCGASCFAAGFGCVIFIAVRLLHGLMLGAMWQRSICVAIRGGAAVVPFVRGVPTLRWVPGLLAAYVGYSGLHPQGAPAICITTQGAGPSQDREAAARAAMPPPPLPAKPLSKAAKSSKALGREQKAAEVALATGGTGGGGNTGGGQGQDGGAAPQPLRRKVTVRVCPSSFISICVPR